MTSVLLTYSPRILSKLLFQCLLHPPHLVLEIFREASGYLWVIVVERWIFVAVGGIVAKRSDKFGHPVEVAAYLVSQFVEHLLLVKALVEHVEDDGSADDALCLPLHCVGGKHTEFLPCFRYYRGVGLIVE